MSPVRPLLTLSRCSIRLWATFKRRRTKACAAAVKLPKPNVKLSLAVLRTSTARNPLPLRFALYNNSLACLIVDVTRNTALLRRRLLAVVPLCEIAIALPPLLLLLLRPLVASAKKVKIPTLSSTAWGFKAWPRLMMSADRLKKRLTVAIKLRLSV